jgi:hypothetical protein
MFKMQSLNYTNYGFDIAKGYAPKKYVLGYTPDKKMIIITRSS